MRKIFLLHVIISLVIIIVAVGGYWLVKNGRINFNLGSPKKANDYQAVFLTNGQVYFGKLSNLNRRYVRLEDIYYLQVQQIQPPEEKTKQEEQPKLTLIKLGNEIHAPEDVMNINRDQILFLEDLKESGQVVQAIQKDKESKK